MPLQFFLLRVCGNMSMNARNITIADIVDVTTKLIVRITVSWFKICCQYNGNEFNAVKCLSRK